MNARRLLLLASLAITASSTSACSTHPTDPTLPSVTVTVGISSSIGPSTQRRVTSSPPGIDCTSDGTTTTGVCEMTFSGVVILDPHTTHGVAWSDDSGMLVWTADAPMDGGKATPNWATINLIAGGASTRRFSVSYSSDAP